MTTRGAPRRPDEPARLASLQDLGVLDTRREPVFDWLVDLAASTLHVPLAMISLVDENRLWFKAVSGDSVSETARAGSMCDWVVARNTLFEVADVVEDARFDSGAMAAAGLRSYAGAPIFGLDGQPVGALCVLDTRARRLNEGERQQLEQIADLVTGQLHLKQLRAKSTADAAAEALSTELRQAVSAGQIVPAFQPIVALSDTSIVGCEALARWNHPTRGLLAPGAFLEVAERDELILDIDIAVMDQAVRQVSRWNRDPLNRARPGVSINVSSRHLHQTDLVRNVRGALETYNVAPQYLTLELTETVLAGADADAVSMFTKLRDLGVSLAIDDFGTAHSSLSYIHKFPVNCIKIDVGFVADLANNEGHEKFVESILGVARRLGMDTVAEGVETEAQATILRNLGCPKAQGYLFAPPLSAKDMSLRLSR
jgi:EAL domain-containing protein (putative c-di-GMP-specific phosphodiesterase class I)